MLAATITDLSQVKLPCIVQPKLDGIRCVVIDGVAYTRKLEPIPNKHIQQELSKLGTGWDGELIVGSPTAPDVFNTTQSAVMSVEGEPDYIYWIFDSFEAWPNGSFITRFNAGGTPEVWHHHLIEFVPVKVAASQSELLFYDKLFRSKGYEGIIIRYPDAPYKFGRSTLKEGALLKYKPFLDSEAEVIGFTPQYRNHNEATKDNLGHTKRSSAKAQKEALPVLGSLLVKDIHTGVKFKIGTGFDLAFRTVLWHNRKSTLGLIVKYKYQALTPAGVPRFPVFLGFRDKRDIDNVSG